MTTKHPEALSLEAADSEQGHLWLRGLLSVAWADGEYDPQEKALIQDLIRLEGDNEILPITPAEFGQRFDKAHAEDFMRTAVMTAIADGVYSELEDEILQDYCQVLGLDLPELEALRATLVTKSVNNTEPVSLDHGDSHQDLLKPLRNWMDGIQVKNRKVAHFLCRLIPSQCPFERDVVLFRQKIVHIPAMCQLNPLYEQVVGLRFRALSYLADECQEDVTQYIQ
jgi:tellurite resistance protein